MRGATQECYAPLGSPPGLVAVAADEESPLERLAPRLNALPQSKLLPRESVEEIAKLAQSSLFTPGASEKQPLLPPALRPGPGSAARFVLLYSVLTCVACCAACSCVLRRRHHRPRSCRRRAAG